MCLQMHATHRSRQGGLLAANQRSLDAHPRRSRLSLPQEWPGHSGRLLVSSRLHLCWFFFLRSTTRFCVLHVAAAREESCTNTHKRIRFVCRFAFSLIARARGSHKRTGRAKPKVLWAFSQLRTSKLARRSTRRFAKARRSVSATCQTPSLERSKSRSHRARALI